MLIKLSGGVIRCIQLNSFTHLIPPSFPLYSNHVKTKHINKPLYFQALNVVRFLQTLCSARRRVRYDDEEEDVEDETNEEIAMLEAYSQSAKEEALLVKASVDEEDVEILIFKGFSSSLSYGTSPDPSTSILPGRAVIRWIDIVKAPVDPSNIQYIHKALTFHNFRTLIQSKFIL